MCASMLVLVCVLYRCVFTHVCEHVVCVCACFACVCALLVCVCALRVCVCALRVCVCALRVCIDAEKEDNEHSTTATTTYWSTLSRAAFKSTHL